MREGGLPTYLFKMYLRVGACFNVSQASRYFFLLCLEAHDGTYAARQPLVLREALLHCSGQVVVRCSGVDERLH